MMKKTPIIFLAAFITAAGRASAENVIGPPRLPAPVKIVSSGAVAPKTPLIDSVSERGRFQYSVYGIGDVVKKYYSSAFADIVEKYRGQREVGVTFVDNSSFWDGNATLAEKMRGTIHDVQAWGGRVVDVATEEGRRAHAELKADAGIVAVPDFAHVDAVISLLDHPHSPRQIYVEKPLDRDRQKALVLLERLGYNQRRVSILDHYGARLSPSAEQMDLMNHHIGGGIQSFAYYFLEDHSGADKSYESLADRDGAIEREQRVKALDAGATMDAIPHLFPLVRRWVDIEVARVTGVRAAQYVGVDGDPDKRTEIKGETYAEVRLQFGRKHNEKGSDFIPGAAYMGKGLRGSRTLGPEYDRNAKLFRIVGLNGRPINFDLRSSSPDGRHSTAYLLSAPEGGEEALVASFPLYAKPYRVFFEKILLGTIDAMQLYEGERILEVIERIVRPMRAAKELPTYPGGMKGRESVYNEDIGVPYLFNNEQGQPSL